MCYYDMYSSRAVEYEKISPSLSPPSREQCHSNAKKNHANKTTFCFLLIFPEAKNLTETLCERPPHSAPTYSIASIVGGGFVLVAYFMRVASKIYFPCQKGARIDNDFWWDDATITIAFLLIIPITALSNVCE